MIALLLQSGVASIVGIVLLLILLVAVWSSVESVPKHEKRALIVRGEYRKLLEPGRTFVLPFISETHAIDMRFEAIDISRQEAITQDDVPVIFHAVVYIKVFDAEKVFLEVDDHRRALRNESEYALGATIGDYESNVVLHNHSVINHGVQQKLNRTIKEWGVRVDSVEIRRVDLPKESDQP